MLILSHLYLLIISIWRQRIRLRLVLHIHRLGYWLLSWLHELLWLWYAEGIVNVVVDSVVATIYVVATPIYVVAASIYVVICRYRLIIPTYTSTLMFLLN